MTIIIVGVLALRRPAWQVAAVAMVATGVVTVATDPSVARNVPSALAAALVLAADAGIVIVPGLWLNDLLKASGGHNRVVEWVGAWPAVPGFAAVILTTGFAPALESITGFGVSLLVTVPVLLHILPRRQALTASLLSLTIMPWGTAGLATSLAADMTGISVTALGTASAMLSFAVFPCFAALVGHIVAGGNRKVVLAGAGLGLLFSTTLLAVNLLGMVSVAGIVAGAVTGVVGYAIMARRSRRLTPRPPWQALAPYGIAIALIVIQHLLGATFDTGRFGAIDAGSVRFEPLTSPGIALCMASIYTAWRSHNTGSARNVASSAWKPVVVLLAFAGVAQFMSLSGAITVIGTLISHTGRVGYIAFAPVLAIASGYLAGSNTAANALMATSQATVGAPWSSTLAVALQNSGAGHAVFASVPETVLVLGIAGEGTRQEETHLLRTAATVLIMVWAIITIGAVVATA